MTRDLKSESQYGDQREYRQFYILVSTSLAPQTRKPEQFQILNGGKLKINLKYLVYYILLWIACVKDTYKMHRYLKIKNSKYLGGYIGQYKVESLEILSLYINSIQQTTKIKEF